MNSYFFKMTNEERNNILDQHKTVYDGFATQYGQPKEQPLYVQDFANDKGGITVSNKGNVMSYRNMNINEMYYSGDASFTPEPSFDFGGPDKLAVNMEEQLDMIGDGPEDMNHGTFEDNDEDFGTMRSRYFDDEDEEPEFENPEILEPGDEMSDDEFIPLQEQVNKTLDMLKRFKNY